MRKIWTPKIILPVILKGDERLKAAREALEEILGQVSLAARETMHLPRLDELPSHMLDILLNQYHADFFEREMTEEVKREIIRDAIEWHRRKGTPASVEEVARKVFRDAHVVEWFEFEGRPFYFRIMQDISTGDEDADRATMDRLRAAVFEAKNMRSWLEFYGFILTLEDISNPIDYYHMNIEQKYYDRYDYRRNNARHDGAIDYGSANLYHNGEIEHDGRISRLDHESQGRHGRFQAEDFEIIRLVHRLTPLQEAFEPTDTKRIRMALTGLKDAVGEIIEGSVRRVLNRLVERVRGIDVLVVTAPIEMKSAECVEYEDCVCEMQVRQKVTHDGHYRREGSVTHSGNLTASEHTLTREEFNRIEEVKTRLMSEYDGECNSCGGSEYELKTGSVRIGTEVFNVDDPQMWTVDIFCRNCGRLINQYLVSDGSWEAVL